MTDDLVSYGAFESDKIVEAKIKIQTINELRSLIDSGIEAGKEAQAELAGEPQTNGVGLL